MRAFDESKKLQDFFNVLSVTEDRDGAFYVSTMEARKVHKSWQLEMDTSLSKIG